MDALLTNDDDGRSVQDSKNVIPVSSSMSEVLIRRVQSPDPLGDSLLLREQLVSILTWNALEGFIPNQVEIHHKPRVSGSSHFVHIRTFIRIFNLSVARQFLTHTTSTIVRACCLKIVYNTSMHQVSLPV